MNIYITPPNTRIIDELYAVLSKDSTGEGIVTYMMREGPLPLMTSDPKIAEHFKGIMKIMNKETNKNLILVKFTNKEIIEEVG